MRRAAYFSASQEDRLATLGASVPEVIEAGLRALEDTPVLRELDADLRESLSKTIKVLDAAVNGKIAVAGDLRGRKQNAGS